MLNTIASPPDSTSKQRYSLYRFQQQTLCRSCVAAEGPSNLIVVLWLTAAQAQTQGLTHCTRCHCPLII